MRRGTLGALALCAVAAWAQDPVVIDLGQPEPELPEWSALGVPGEDARLSGDPPKLSPARRSEALDAIELWLEERELAGRVERSDMRFLTDAAHVAVLERCLAPLRAQLVDRPLLRVTLVPLEPAEAAQLPLGQLPERVAAQLTQRAPLARLSARARGGWLNARAVTGQELLVDYEVDQSGVLPVRTPRVQRVNAGVAARLRLTRQADGTLRAEGVLEFARALEGKRVSFDGQPLDLPAADRLRVVGTWSLPSGRPVLVAACSVPNPSAYRAWGLVLQVEAQPLPAPSGEGEFVWLHDLGPLLPSGYTAVDRHDPFARVAGRGSQLASDAGYGTGPEQRQAETRAWLSRVLERADFPPIRALSTDGTRLYATGTRAAQLSLSTLIASKLPEVRSLCVQLRLGDEPPGVLRMQIVRGRPACVLVGREARELVGSETLAGGTEEHAAEVALPTLLAEAEGFELWVEPGAGDHLSVEGRLKAVRGREALETVWGPFAQLDRQRLRLAGEGACSSGSPLELGRGPWGGGTAWAQAKVEK